MKLCPLKCIFRGKKGNSLSDQGLDCVEYTEKPPDGFVEVSLGSFSLYAVSHCHAAKAHFVLGDQVFFFEYSFS